MKTLGTLATFVVGGATALVLSVYFPVVMTVTNKAISVVKNLF